MIGVPGSVDYDLGAVPVHILEPVQATRAASATLAYTTADPYAARLELRRNGETIAWRFALDLLSEGMATMVGIGAARVWPAGVSVFVEYGDGVDKARVELPRMRVHTFLAMVRRIASGKAVEAGASQWVDSALVSLLGGAS